MNKVLGLVTLMCYFAALMLGLMWYLTYRQLSIERMVSMSRTEEEGYLAIPPPSGKDIKKLLDQRIALESWVNQLDSELTAKREEHLKLTQNVNRLKKELNDLAVKKNANEQGEKLARTLAAMKPEEAATALASLDQTVLPDVVEYALPYMEDKAFAKLMGAISKMDTTATSSLAGRILEIIGTSLFSMDLKLQSDLDAGLISEQIQLVFKDNGLALSAGARLSVEKKAHRWLIADGTQSYHIRSERGKLNVYVRKVSQAS